MRSMTVPRFVDTNVLLYAVSSDPAEERKRRMAEEIFDARDLVLSSQVLGEFYVQATRSTRSARTSRLTHGQATAIIRSMTRYPIQPVTYGIVEAALAASERHLIPYWDAAILEAARAAGCDHVLTEDLAAGRDYDGVSVVNPFS
jgi:predicted nucleic acid-binding protein